MNRDILKKGHTMKQIPNFSNYFIDSGKIYKKTSTGFDQIRTYGNKFVQMKSDRGSWFSLEIGKVLHTYSFKDYMISIMNMLKEQTNYDYHVVPGTTDYLFCTKAEDEQKLYSISSKKFIKAKRIGQRVRFTLCINSRITVKYLTNIVYEFLTHKQVLPRNFVVQINGNLNDFSIENLAILYQGDYKAYNEAIYKYNKNLITKEEFISIVQRFEKSSRDSINTILNYIEKH